MECSDIEQEPQFNETQTNNDAEQDNETVAMPLDDLERLHGHIQQLQSATEVSEKHGKSVILYLYTSN